MTYALRVITDLRSYLKFLNTVAIHFASRVSEKWANDKKDLTIHIHNLSRVQPAAMNNILQIQITQSITTLSWLPWRKLPTNAKAKEFLDITDQDIECRSSLLRPRIQLHATSLNSSSANLTLFISGWPLSSKMEKSSTNSQHRAKFNRLSKNKQQLNTAGNFPKFRSRICRSLSSLLQQLTGATPTTHAQSSPDFSALDWWQVRLCSLSRSMQTAGTHSAALRICYEKLWNSLVLLCSSILSHDWLKMILICLLPSDCRTLLNHWKRWIQGH